MGKCPYCNKELHIEDFFEITKKETKKGKIKVRIGNFKGESVEPRRMGLVYCDCKMWVCPYCEAILGFTEVGWESG